MGKKQKNKIGLIILGITLVLLFPIVLNWLILRPAIVEVVGDGADWLDFWGSYLSALISSGVAFVILVIQFRQNRDENENNRKLQKSVLKHQLRSQWVASLKTLLIVYYRGFDYKGVLEIASFISEKQNKDYVRSKVVDMWDAKEKATLEVKMMFSSDLSERERDSLNLLADFDEQYNALLEDLNWFCDIAYLNGSNTLNYNTVKKATEKFKGLHFIENNYRIWHIVERYEYKVLDNIKDVVKERLEVLNDYAECLLWGAIEALVNYEQHELDKILIDSDKSE